MTDRPAIRAGIEKGDWLDAAWHRVSFGKGQEEEGRLGPISSRPIMTAVRLWRAGRTGCLSNHHPVQSSSSESAKFLPVPGVTSRTMKGGRAGRPTCWAEGGGTPLLGGFGVMA